MKEDSWLSVFDSLLNAPLIFNFAALFPPLAAANKALEENLQVANAASDQTVAELKERIQALEKELDNANELLSYSKLRGNSVLLFPWMQYDNASWLLFIDREPSYILLTINNINKKRHVLKLIFLFSFVHCLPFYLFCVSRSSWHNICAYRGTNDNGVTNSRCCVKD